jgi:hypothetical protein
MKEMHSPPCDPSSGSNPLTLEEQSLILTNLRLSVAERWRQHDAALRTLNKLRAAVRQLKFIQTKHKEQA